VLHFHLMDALFNEVFRVELESLRFESALGDGLQIFVAFVEEEELCNVGFYFLHHVHVSLAVEGRVLERVAVENVID